MEDFGDEFMKGKQLTLSSQPGVERDKEQLLTFYRERFELFEKERQDWLQRLEQLRGRQDDYLRCQWELRRREEEISSLQKQLSEVQLQLFQERQQVLRLTADNNQLQLQEHSDRKKILDLLQLTEVQEDPQPPVPHKSLSSACSICKHCREGLGCAIHGSRPKTAKTHRSAKGVYVPNEEINVLKLDLEGLRRQLEMERMSHEAEIRLREEDRKTREEEFAAQQTLWGKRLQEVQEALDKSEKARAEAIKDYLLGRHNALQREQQQAELNQSLQYQLDHALQQLRETATYYRAQSLEAERVAEQKTSDFAHHFRTQVVDGEENLSVVKEQYGQMQQLYSQKIADLEQRLSALTSKYDRIKSKRNYENQYYKRDVEQLKTIIKKAEEPEAEKTQKRPVEVKPCQRCAAKAEKTQTGGSNTRD